MADRYWRGGTGTWDTTTTTNWSATSGGAGGASVPTAADNVIFDQAGTYSVTMTGALACLSITVSAGTVSFLTGTTPTLAVSGSMSLIAGTVWTSTGAITFNATTTGKTITTGGTTINGSITFDGVGGEWSLGSAVTVAATQTTTLTNGSLVLNGYNLTTGIFSSNNSNTRSVNFGSNIITLNATATTVLSMATLTGFTPSGTGGFSIGNMTTPRTITCGSTAGGSTATAPNLSFTIGGSITNSGTITSGSWFNKLDYAASLSSGSWPATTVNVSSITLSASMNTTNNITVNLVGSGTITCNGKSTGTMTLLAGTPTFADTCICTSFVVNGPTFNFTTGTINPSASFVMTSGTFTYNGGTLGAVPTFTHTNGTVQFNYNYSLTATGTYTLTAGTLTINDGVILTTGIFSSSNTNTRTINFGLTSPGWITLSHTTAATVVLSMAIVTGLTVTEVTNSVPAGGFISDASITRTFTCGTTGGNAANSPCLYFTSGTALPTFTTGSWFNILYLYNLGAIGTVAATTLNLNGLVSSPGGGVYTSMSVNFVGTGTAQCSGIASGPVNINNGSGLLTLFGALVSTTCTFTSGSVDHNGYYITPTTTFTYVGGTFVNGPYITCTTFTVSGGTLTLTSPYEISPTTSFVITAGTFIYNGGTFPALPTFTHTAGNVTFNYNYSLTATGTYTLTAGSLVLTRGVTLNTGIFSSTGAGTRSIGFGSSISSSTTGSVLFNGSSQYLTVDNSASSPQFQFGSSDFTIECWIYPTVGGLNQGIISKLTNVNTQAGPFLILLTSSNVPVLYSASTGGGAGWDITALGTQSVALNTWSHIAVTRYGNVFTIWVNGVSSGTVTTNFVLFDNYNDLVEIGAADSLGNSSYLFNGYISNVRIVKGLAVYTSTFTPPIGPLASTQSANTNGNPSSAITGLQTSLLLNTAYNSNFLTDSSFYAFTITNNSNATSSSISPYLSNINLTHTTAATVVLNMVALGGFSWTGTGGFTVADMSNTRTFSVGSTSGGSQTTGPNLTFTTGASVATLTTNSWFNNLNYGSTTFVHAASTLNIDGNVTLGGGTYPLTLNMIGTGTINSNAKSITALTIGSATYAGTTTLGAALTITGALTLTQGTLLCPYNITSASFASSGPYTRTITGTNTTYTVTGAGATAWSFASTGSVLFNGTSQYLIAPVGSSTFGSGDFTVECWFYKTSATTCTLIDNATGNADNNYWALSTYADGHCQFTIRDTVGQTTLIGTITTALNTWAHVAIVRQSGVCNLYINGVFDTSTTIATAITGRTTNIGSFQYTGFVDYFPGYITNVRTVTGVAVYTGNFTVPTKPLTPTQSAGTNINAITGSQTSLLLTTSNDSTFLKDYSTNNFTITNTGTATANALSPFTVASPGITFTGFTINMNSASAKTFAGGGGTYPVLNNGGAGALTISGSNTFDTISNSVQPTTFTFTIATTQTVNNFNVAGIAGSLVTINSSTAASVATLSKASGTVYGSYLSIRDSTATGGATWYAGPTSTNTSNNTGWIFTRLPIVTMGNLVIDGGISIS